MMCHSSQQHVEHRYQIVSNRHADSVNYPNVLLPLSRLSQRGCLTGTASPGPVPIGRTRRDGRIWTRLQLPVDVHLRPVEDSAELLWKVPGSRSLGWEQAF
ncbi:hypothetical protein PISMIDRAFT_687653 [Pisolithus microcarpus 441]|uniref:Uncharacterized protein n=1 Tax=Pisolithus microcarpus 441 TaxID=765257 RepID=A0A0C9YX88_9AGAM|nr:hypothetical protein PISMIDRAFT_687653 [Pisolithus microcarpus 441]